MADPVLLGKKLNQLNFLAQAIGAELYGEKGGLPWRLRAGDPNGLATLDETGGIRAEQMKFRQPGPGTVLREMGDKLAESPSVFDYMTEAQRADVQARTKLLDVSDELNEALEKNTFCEFPPGDYLVSKPIIVQSHRQIIAKSPSGDIGVRIFADTAATWATGRGVVETSNFSWVEADGGTPGFWHNGLIENVNIDANDVADYGLVVWCSGEESVVRRAHASGGKVANILYGGYMAVGHLEASSAWHSTGYGLLMSDHPDPDFAPGVSGADGGRGNGGSIRLIGFSGDYNALGHICATGTQIVDLIGLKSEYNNPCILIKGGSAANDRQRWNISGYRHEAGTTAPVRDFIRIEDAGTSPQIVIGAGACYNTINLVNDVANAVVIPKQSEGFCTIYDLSNDVCLYGRHARLPGVVVNQSDAQLDSASWTLAHHGYGSPATTNLRMTWDIRDVGSERVRMRVGITPSTVFSVDSTSTGNGVALWSYNGTTTEQIVTTQNTGGVASVTIGKSAAQKIGFYGAAPVAKPTITGSRGGNAALASLLTQLASCGLITDSSS